MDYKERTRKEIENNKRLVFLLKASESDIESSTGYYECTIRMFDIYDNLIKIYRRLFEVDKFSKKHYENFVNKFCRDVEYRKQYELEMKQTKKSIEIDDNLKLIVDKLNYYGFETRSSCQSLKKYEKNPKSGHNVLAYIEFKKKIPEKFMKFLKNKRSIKVDFNKISSKNLYYNAFFVTEIESALNEFNNELKREASISSKKSPVIETKVDELHNLISVTISKLSFLKKQIYEKENKPLYSTLETNVEIVKNNVANIAKLLGVETSPVETVETKDEKTKDEIKHVISKLTKLLEDSNKPNDVFYLLNRYQEIVKAWYQNEGFAKTNKFEFTKHGIQIELDNLMYFNWYLHPMMNTEADKELWSDEVGTSYKIESGWDIEVEDEKAYLLDSQKNKDKLTTLLKKCFKDVRIIAFNSRNENYRFGLNVEFFISYSDLEEYYSKK